MTQQLRHHTIKLIGLHGKAGCGKTTVGDYLAGSQGAIPLSFALPLKLAATELFAVEFDYFESQDLKNTKLYEWDLTPREILQKLGTEGMRNLFGQDFWLKRMHLELDANTYDGDLVVITDCRFQNEVDFIKDNGGIVIHLTRAGADGNIGIQNHASEADLDFSQFTDSNYVRVSNDGTVQKLYENLDCIVEQYI